MILIYDKRYQLFHGIGMTGVGGRSSLKFFMRMSCIFRKKA